MPDYFYSEDRTPRIDPRRAHHDNRIVTLSGPITDAMAHEVNIELQALCWESHAPIQLILNSPGGSVSAGFSIIDHMALLDCEVHTLGIGMVASMAAVILACGTPGKRSATPNADILIHQPLIQGGLSGQAVDVGIAADAILKKRAKINSLLTRVTGNPIEKIEATTDRDKWLTAEEAVSFGIIDRIHASNRKGK